MKQLVAFTFVIFLMTLSVAAAAPITLDVVPAEQTVKPGQNAVYLATVDSVLKDGGLSVFVVGRPSYWISMGTSYIDLPIKNPIETMIEILPGNNPGTYEYELIVQSTNDPSKKVSKILKLNVLGADKVTLTDSDISNDDDSVNIRLGLQSSEETQADIEFSIVSSSGKTVATAAETVDIDGRENVTYEILLGDELLAGLYTVKVKVDNTSIALEKLFEISPVRKVVKKEEESSNYVSQETTISVSNEGNVVEEDYVVTSNVPTGFVTYSRDPDSCDDGVCEWILSKLNPLEDAHITYRIDYWPLFAEGLLVAVLLGTFVFFGWRRVTVPGFSKTVEMSRDGSLTAMLEIKTRKKLTNVVVSDTVSPLFKLERNFETVKPDVSHGEEGTELSWSLPSIEPGDHRILHYKMKPVVNGHLKVDSASMQYATENGKLSSIKTKETYLAA